jgi:phospholipid/cholesterol/gamma-HCH transport system permease protein
MAIADPHALPEPAAAPARPARPRATDGFLAEAGELTVFAARAVRGLAGAPRYISEAMRLNALITRRTSVLLFVMCFFLGMSAANFGFFFLRAIGASDFVGVVSGLLTPRQIAPQMFGYVVSGSICCAIAAELGSAKIQQEISAYESQGIDPMQFLVGARLIAVLLWVPLATALSYFGCLAGGYVAVVVILEGNSSQVFLSSFFSIQNLADIVFCLVTIACVAFVCVLVSCFYGLRTRGGPDAVGGAVARSLAVNLVLLHVVGALCAIVYYGGGLLVPIGD